MATVYKAYDTRLEADVALKKYPADCTGTVTETLRMRSESVGETHYSLIRTLSK
jgi:hypothetical protein